MMGDADPCPCCGYKRRRSASPPVDSSTVAAAQPPGNPIPELDKKGAEAARPQRSPYSSPLPLNPAPSTSSVAQLVVPKPEGKNHKEEEKKTVEIKVAQGTQVKVSFKCKCGWCQEVFFN